MIERIKLRNFKSIVDIDLALQPLNILIGRNGSGKSNLLSFFHLLHQGANGHLSAQINALGGFSQVLHYAAAAQQGSEWELTFRDLLDIDRLYYSGQLARRGNGYTIRLEELERDPYTGYDQRYKFLSAADGHVRILKSRPDDGQDEKNLSYDESDQELVIVQVRDRVRYPALAEVRGEIENWQVFRGFGSEALQRIRGPQIFNAPQPLRLDPGGSNLVSVLQQMANESRYAAAFERLEEVLGLVFPDFVKLDIPITAGGMGSLSYRSRDLRVSVPAISMSDGQLRFLGLAALLLLPDPPTLIAIDEPEIGLHPDMLPVLIELLQEASQRTQIIVTTHSPQLVDLVKPEDVYVVEREGGRTRFDRPDSVRLQRWLERYTLGKLWTMGKLEA